jgi:hypothetical protein
VVSDNLSYLVRGKPPSKVNQQCWARVTNGSSRLGPLVEILIRSKWSCKYNTICSVTIICWQNGKMYPLGKIRPSRVTDFTTREFRCTQK